MEVEKAPEGIFPLEGAISLSDLKATVHARLHTKADKKLHPKIKKLKQANEDAVEYNGLIKKCLSRRAKDDPDDNQYGSNKRRKIKKRAGSQNQKAARASHSAKVHKAIDAGLLNLKEFELLNLLGEGRTGRVFEARWHGEKVALKICDITQHPECERELINEVEVYNSLKDLQGHYIPRLRAAGFSGGDIFGIVTDVVGYPIDVDQLNYTECQKVVEALSEIHRHGVLHNDIREDNILIQHDGNDDDGFKVSIIDFAFSKFERHEDLLPGEMALLKALLRIKE